MSRTERRTASAETMRRVLTIRNARGLHARASAKFVKCVENYDADIRVTRDGQTVSGTSIMGLLMLAASPGSTILVEATGSERIPAMAALESLIDNKFDED